MTMHKLMAETMGKIEMTVLAESECYNDLVQSRYNG